MQLVSLTRALKVAIVISTLYQLTSALVGDITASTCADPQGFAACLQPVSAAALKCSAQAGSDAVSGAVCDCEKAISEVQCALSSCWNVVYGCEYQSLANFIVGACAGQNVPFFPAPENAPGGCSCNLGHVIFNMSAVSTQILACTKSAANLQQLNACACCYAAGEYTSKFSICPNTDPTLDGFDGDLGLVAAEVPQWGQCGVAFNQFSCVNDLGFPAIGSLPYLSALPASTGTATLSTLPGTISAPLSPSQFVWTLSWTQGVTSATITVAGAKAAKSSGSAGSTQSSGSGSSTQTSRGKMMARVPEILLIVAVASSLLSLM